MILGVKRHGTNSTGSLEGETLRPSDTVTLNWSRSLCLRVYFVVDFIEVVFTRILEAVNAGDSGLGWLRPLL